MPKVDRPNCYECVHRGKVPGSAHSKCDHPKAKNEINEDPFIKLMSMLGGRDPMLGAGMLELGVKGSDHGIIEGWFNWPWNFDPVWLETCDGFTRKEK